MHTIQTISNCSNCNKVLSSGCKQYCERSLFETECAECRFQKLNSTRTIQKYNEWLKKL